MSDLDVKEGTFPSEEDVDVMRGLPPEGVEVEDGEETGANEPSSGYIPPEEAEKSLYEEEDPAKKTISIDNTDEEVLQWDREGRELFFEVGDGFLPLSGEVVRKLSLMTRRQYFIAKGETECSLRVEGSGQRDEVLSDLYKKYSVEGATATQRLQVRGGDPSMTYSHFNVKRLGLAEQKGWVPVRKDEEAAAFSHDTAGSSVTLKDTRGEVEMILMKKDREAFEREQKTTKLLRKKRLGRLKQEDVAALEGLGFDPEEDRYNNPNRKWKEIKR